MNSKATIVGCAAALVLTSSSFAANPTTVGVLNPTPGTQTIVDSPQNVGNANFLGQAAMSSLISSAFANDTGGVVNWDSANGWVVNQTALSYTVSYGTSQSQSLTITRDDGGGLNTFAASTGSGSTPTSGDQYLGLQNSGSPFTLTFDKGLTAWGMTQLNRFSSRTVTMSFTLADNTVITYNAQTQDPTGGNVDSLNWYGFQATEANPLTKVTITANGFVRYDDMAFVAVPEPGMAAWAGLGTALTLLRFRRSRN
jgi:hypothetical protein